MKTNRSKVLLLKIELLQIVGSSIEVLNALGRRLLEKPYENALVVAFALRRILFCQQPSFDVRYKEKKFGVFDRITDHEHGLMLNDLRITDLRVGVILNFKHRKLEWERIAYNIRVYWCSFVVKKNVISV
jgi:PD-(D/E)XK nuclease superfamily